MERQFEIMVCRSDLEKIGFKKNQSLEIMKECKKYLIEIEGINFYANRQVCVVPARILERLFDIQLTIQV